MSAAPGPLDSAPVPARPPRPFEALRERKTFSSVLHGVREEHRGAGLRRAKESQADGSDASEPAETRGATRLSRPAADGNPSDQPVTENAGAAERPAEQEHGHPPDAPTDQRPKPADGTPSGVLVALFQVPVEQAHGLHTMAPHPTDDQSTADEDQLSAAPPEPPAAPAMGLLPTAFHTEPFDSTNEGPAGSTSMASHRASLPIVPAAIPLGTDTEAHVGTVRTADDGPVALQRLSPGEDKAILLSEDAPEPPPSFLGPAEALTDPLEPTSTLTPSTEAPEPPTALLRQEPPVERERTPRVHPLQAEPVREPEQRPSAEPAQARTGPTLPDASMRPAAAQSFQEPEQDTADSGRQRSPEGSGPGVQRQEGRAEESVFAAGPSGMPRPADHQATGVAHRVASSLLPAEPADAPASPASRSVAFEVLQPDLGRINVRVAMTHDIVHTHISSERADVGQLLVNGQDRLQAALQANGLDMGQFRVDIDRQSGGRSFQQSAYQDQEHGRAGQQPFAHQDGRQHSHAARDGGRNPRLGMLNLVA